MLVSRASPGDPTIRIEFANGAFCQMTGFDAEEVGGESPGILVGPDTDLDTLREIESSLRVGKPITRDVILYRSDRSSFLAEANYLRHDAEDGSRWYASTFRDMTSRGAAADRLHRSEQWAKALVQGGSDLVLVVSADGRVKYASPSVRKILGFSPEEFVGINHAELLHPEDLPLLRAMMRPGTLDEGSFEVRAHHRDGSWRVLDMAVSDMLTDPSVEGIVVNVRDVTERRQAEQLLAEQADLLEAIARGAPLEITLQKITQMIEHTVEGTLCAIGMLDTDGAIRVRAAPSIPRQIINLLDDLNPRSEPGQQLRDNATDGSFTVYDLERDERFCEIEVFREHQLAACRVAPILAPGSSELIGALTVFDVDRTPLDRLELELLGRATNLAAIAIERRRFESTLEYQALYDNLTGLPNRTLLVSRIADSLERATRLGTGIAVLFLDLDRFKVINDSLGHELGDQLLQMVAERLREPLRPGDTLGRFGADEFMVVCNRIPNDTAALSAAGRFGSVLKGSFELDGGDVFVTASIGVAHAEEGHVTPESLIRRADVAMYRAKDQGRNQHVIFQENLDNVKVEQLALEQALRNAIDQEEFELHFQPVVELSDGSMTHAEALVRWLRPGHGMVMPGGFIPLAEETGLIVPLGWWVLEEACRWLAAWPLVPGKGEVEIAVNLSARQLAASELLEVVSEVLTSTGVEPHRLCFEITESDLVHDVSEAVESLNRLKELGVQIAIDDFGTGYASLDYIRHFTMADYLKIDRSFVDGVEKEGSQEAAICTAAIALARSLGMRVIAEGVETLFQKEALEALECDLAQGYLFSRPIPVREAMELMVSR